MDIEFATRKELIEELMSRATFTGLVVTTVDEIKDGAPPPETASDFLLAAKNLEPDVAIDILQETIEQLRSGLEDEPSWD